MYPENPKHKKCELSVLYTPFSAPPCFITDLVRDRRHVEETHRGSENAAAVFSSLSLTLRHLCDRADLCKLLRNDSLSPPSHP